jgi:hypothetical protein
LRDDTADVPPSSRAPGAACWSACFRRWPFFWGRFGCFSAATFFGGVYQAVVLSFRFAVADGVSPECRPRAMSAVMAGGVFAGVLGPQLVTFTMDL